MVVRVGHKAPAVRVEGTIISRLRRPIRLEPSRYRSAQRALWYREGGGRWHVRPRVLCVPSRKSLIRDFSGQTLYVMDGSTRRFWPLSVTEQFLSTNAPKSRAERGPVHGARAWEPLHAHAREHMVMVMCM